jgi:hypothetical protein
LSALRQTDLERRPEQPERPAAPSRGPIHVAGMARAGTSWVAEMLRASGGFVHLNEPFNPKRPPGQSPGILNAAVPVGYIYVAEHNADAFRPALHDTFRFRYRHLAEVRQNHTWFDLAKMAKYSSAFALGALRRRRPLLDDPYASLAAPWIAQEFDGQVALLVRHPAAMVASYRKLGYRAHFRHFLDQPELMADHLEPWRSEMEGLVETEDRVAQVATFWAMLHRVLFDMADRSHRLHIVRYEDLCADPPGEFERLFTRMGLHFNDAARDEIIRGTEGSSKNQSHAWRVSRHGGLSRTAFRPMDSKSMIWAWKKTITPVEAARIRIITSGVADRCYSDADW